MVIPDNGGKKKLSGAVMGMKFMQRRQRKGNSTSPPKSRDPETSKTKAKSENDSNDEMEESTTQQATREGNEHQKIEQQQRQNETQAAFPPPQFRKPAPLLPPPWEEAALVENKEERRGKDGRVAEAESDAMVATNADMYGSAALIVGRRSFGGFNVATERTWNAAYEAWSNQGSDGGGVAKVSDEELLRRYEDHLRRNSKNEAVGNLKQKNPRNNHKRKR